MKGVRRDQLGSRLLGNVLGEIAVGMGMWEVVGGT